MTSPADTPTSRASRRSLRPRRVDALDGLRTIAVLLVAAYHLSVPGFHGGFLGVDVFFVLSGFLITTLLLREVSRRGRIDLVQFWQRRVLRLMPAALIVIGAVLVWAMVWAAPYRRSSIGADAVWSLLYVGNWRFISTSSYFADDGTRSPLQHVWSLAVEEQFYLAWPLLLGLLVLLVLGRHRPSATPLDSSERSERTTLRKRRMSAATLVVALLISVASAVALAVLYDPQAPDRAYMGTDTKAFEPLIGAGAAALMLRPGLRAWVTSHAQVLIALGGLGMIAGVATLGGVAAPSPTYFRGGAVLFALACAVLVAATSVADRRHGLTLVLGSTPLAYLGRISYGIYLWHWPLAVWIVQGHGFSPRRAALAFALTLVLASLSYHLVELPIRTGRLPRLPAWRTFVPAGTSIAVGIVVAALLGGSPLNRIVPAVAAGSGGGNEASVVAIGDSVIQRLMPALATAGEKRGVTVLNAARGGCPAIGVDIMTSAGTVQGDGSCGAAVPQLQDETIRRAQPGTVLWWSRYELQDRPKPGGGVLKAGTPAFWNAQRTALKAAVERLTATGAHLVIVETDRIGDGIDTRCSPQKCDPFLDRLRNHDDIREEWNRILRAEAATDPRVSVIGVDDLYCRDSGNPCDDSTPIRTDPDNPFSPADGAGYARPDGAHFSKATMPAMAADLLDRVTQTSRAAYGRS